MKGGLGSASIVDPVLGVTIGAIVAVNAMGSPLIPGSRVFHAWSVEREGEFGGLRPDGITPDLDQDSLRPSGGASENTTIAVVATDARLSKAEAQRLAIMAQTGLARAIRPAHTPLDGDMVFALSTSKTPLDGDPRSLARLGGFCSGCACTCHRTRGLRGNGLARPPCLAGSSRMSSSPVQKPDDARTKEPPRRRSHRHHSAAGFRDRRARNARSHRRRHPRFFDRLLQHACFWGINRKQLSKRSKSRSIPISSPSPGWPL